MPGREGEGGKERPGGPGAPALWLPPPQKAGEGGGREPEKGPPPPPSSPPPSRVPRFLSLAEHPRFHGDCIPPGSRGRPLGSAAPAQPPRSSLPGRRLCGLPRLPFLPFRATPLSSSVFALHSPSLSRGLSRSRSGVASTSSPQQASSSSSLPASPPPLDLAPRPLLSLRLFLLRCTCKSRVCAEHCARCGDAGGEVPRRRGVCVWKYNQANNRIVMHVKEC